MADPDEALIEALPLTQYLVMEVLAARWCTGEDHWTFPTRTTPAVRRLEALGLVRWKSGIVERTILVWLTYEGRALFLSDDWTPPAAMVAHLGLVEETRHLCSCGGNWKALQHTFADVHEPQPIQRRLVSRWVEVDHGSE